MPRPAMRMKLSQYIICLLFLFGSLACNQQSQNNIEEKTTPDTEPVPTQGAVEPQEIVRDPNAPVVLKEKRTQKPEKRGRLVKSNKQSAPLALDDFDTIAASKAVRQKPLGRRVSRVTMNGKYVALTFDDGPHPSLTPRALDILKRYGAKGTFFMLGRNANYYKRIVARAANEGHEIGVHTWSHIKMNSSSRARVDSEVSRTQNVLASITGTVPRVMRPPYGSTNAALVNHMYNKYGMASILWDVDTIDWRKPGINKVISTAVNRARPGSIILVHDIHATTLAALEGIVTGLQARGFKLVTVSELMMLAQNESTQGTAEPQPAPAPEPTPAPVPAPEPAPAHESAPAPVPAPEPAPAPAPETTEQGTTASEENASLTVLPVQTQPQPDVPAEVPVVQPESPQQQTETSGESQNEVGAPAMENSEASTQE